MRTETGHVQPVLSRDDCQMLAQAVRVFAQQLLDDCRRDMQGKNGPAEVTARLDDLEEVAATLTETDGVDMTWEGMVKEREAERGERRRGRGLSSADWRAIGAAAAFLAAKVRAGGDRVNGERLRDLSEKANDVGSEFWERLVREREARLKEYKQREGIRDE